MNNNLKSGFFHSQGYKQFELLSITFSCNYMGKNNVKYLENCQ
jgi:hypothetical protein